MPLNQIRALLTHPITASRALFLRNLSSPVVRFLYATTYPAILATSVLIWCFVKQARRPQRKQVWITSLLLVSNFTLMGLLVLELLLLRYCSFAEPWPTPTAGATFPGIAVMLAIDGWLKVARKARSQEEGVELRYVPASRAGDDGWLGNIARPEPIWRAAMKGRELPVYEEVSERSPAYRIYQ